MALYETDFSKYPTYSYAEDDDGGNEPKYAYDPLDRKRRSPEYLASRPKTRTLDDRQIPWVYTPERYVKPKPEEEVPEEEVPTLPKISRMGARGGFGRGDILEDSARVTETISPEVIGRKTTVEWLPPDMDKPTVDLPNFEAPDYDRRRVRQLTQEQAAPQVRRLRDSVQQAMGRSFENPNVQAMTLREALSGYGLGLEGAMAGAQDRAMREYATEYEGEYQEATRQHATDVQEEMAEFEAAWNDYLKNYTQVTSYENEYEDKVRTTASYKDQSYVPASDLSNNTVLNKAKTYSIRAT